MAKAEPFNSSRPLADMRRLVVRNTFLEEEQASGSDDDLDIGEMQRGITEPPPHGRLGHSPRPFTAAAAVQPGEVQSFGLNDIKGEELITQDEPPAVGSSRCSKARSWPSQTRPSQQALQAGQQAPTAARVSAGSMGTLPLMPEEDPSNAEGGGYGDAGGRHALTADTGRAFRLQEQLIHAEHSARTEDDLRRISTPEPADMAGMSSNLEDVAFAARGALKMTKDDSTKATLIAIKDMTCSVTLADPDLPDVPLIGCSDGFEALSGFQQAEVVGKNCRFMNRHVSMHPNLRRKLREACMLGQEFLGVVPNMRKSGELFENFLHLTTLSVRDKKYIIGIQADATTLGLNMDDDGHVQALKDVSSRIFSSHLDAWIQLQAWEFAIRLPASYHRLLKMADARRFGELEREFVKVVETRPAEIPSIPSRAGQTASSDWEVASSTVAGAGEGSMTVGVAALSSKQEVEAPMPARVPTTSAGSINHPHDCVECTFHFFGAHGCREGVNCRYCHELHPRKNMKNNRRFMKRLAIRNPGLAASGKSEQELASQCDNVGDDIKASNTDATADTHCSDTSSPRVGSSFTPVCKDSPSLMTDFERSGASSGHDGGSEYSAQADSSGVFEPRWDAQAQERGPRQKRGNDATGKSLRTGLATGTGHCQAGMVYAGAGEKAVTLSYCDAAPNARVTLAVAIRCDLRLKMTFASKETQDALAPGITFSMEPPLPKGLHLDPQTGTISGVPLETHGRLKYTVSAKTPVYGPGGVSLGQIPIATCWVSCRIVELNQFVLRSSSEDEDRQGQESGHGGRLKLHLELARVPGQK
eukprot:TRINITY_DN11849_c0_g1_i2.p1 TRINITY_DN11849_c0_g1~~TRINITY_DN11849_c0_g1_i2.p1  ORF type:complete len:815 (-),score=137.44 TRINITY_DN11849_c0_g1_i2:314-2758(-)